MGSFVSTENGTSETISKDDGETIKAYEELRSHVEDEGRGSSTVERNQAVGQISEPRFTALMQALKRIARLQREAVNARIDGRQKRREAFFMRQDVWIRDAKFMEEVQRLEATGKFAGCEELIRLASDCQAARDGLGPVEQEGIEAEQQWQGQMWKLRQAEEHIYAEFRDEFDKAENYSDGTASLASSPFRSSSDVESQPPNNAVNNHEAESSRPRPYRVAASQIAPSMASSSSFSPLPPGITLSAELDEAVPRELILLGMDTIDGTLAEGDDHAIDDDSGIGDLNESLAYVHPPESFGPGVPLPEQDYNRSLEPYPQLLTDFTSGRDRINKWLENTTLASRFEATSMYNTLKSQLQAEKKEVPSNWAQLVIAYWELKGALIGKNPVQGNSREMDIPKNKNQEEAKVFPVEQQLSYGAGMLQPGTGRSPLFSKSTLGEMMSSNDSGQNGNSMRSLDSKAVSTELSRPLSLSPLSPPLSHQSYESGVDGTQRQTRSH